MLRSILFLSCLYLSGAELATYYLEVLLHKIDDASCDNCKISAKVYSQEDKLGNVYSADLGQLDKPQQNDFRADEWDYFSTRAEDVGIIECIEFYAKSSDGILVSQVRIFSTSHSQPIHVYNTVGKWLSNKSIKDHVPKLKLCSQGIETYFITTKVSTKADAESSNIHLMAVIEGAEASTKTGYFKHARQNDFRRGTHDTFVFQNLKEVHGVKCITLKAGGGDCLILEWIKVESSTQPTVTFKNDKLTGLSIDRGEGTSSLKLCK